MIRVRQRADRFHVIGPPKTAAANRQIPMTPMVRNTLREWKLRCPDGALNLVFPNRAGNIESHGNLYNRYFGPLQVECGITNDGGRARFGFHALRHAAASLFIEQGLAPKKVQTIMGHTSITMTFDTYGKLFPDPESDAEAFEQIEARLVG